MFLQKHVLLLYKEQISIYFKIKPGSHNILTDKDICIDKEMSPEAFDNEKIQEFLKLDYCEEIIIELYNDQHKLQSLYTKHHKTKKAKEIAAQPNSEYRKEELILNTTLRQTENFLCMPTNSLNARVYIVMDSWSGNHIEMKYIKRKSLLNI